jgi:outer membrane protein assembly factor BamB
MSRTVKSLVCCIACLSLLSVAALADDWPTYAHDAARSAVSAEALAPPLSQDWVFTPLAPPRHAWGDPQPKPIEKNLELPRMRFDDAFHVAAAGGQVYFGSSTECKVYALDAATGAVRWDFCTEAPVRMAPTVWKDKVYAGSDDGRVYCLAAGDGRLLWTFSAAPTPEQVLGNGRMASLWPVRTGVLVDNGVAYFAAGVFPAEGLYLYAVKADDGTLVWRNDTYGRGGMGTITPQGYILASAARLFVPSGRTMPAAFNREDGEFAYHKNFAWREYGFCGGTYNLLAGDLLFTAIEQIVGVHEHNGALAVWEGLRPDVPSEGARRMAVDKDVVYVLNSKEATAFDRAAWLQAHQRQIALRGQTASLQKQVQDLTARAKSDPAAAKQLEDLRKTLSPLQAERKNLDGQLAAAVKWKVPCPHHEAIALTRGTLLAGGDGAVAALDPATGKTAWSAPVTGKARGLAVAGGRLYVSTDKGAIHCFVAGQGGKGRKAAPAVAAEPFPKDNLTDFYAATAERIVRESGAARGYGLVLGGGTGRLTLELARRTELLLTMVEPDAAKAAAARRALSAAGVYGTKVTVAQAPLDALPYADYFANLIVCEEGLLGDTVTTPPAEVLRMLKPCGGVAYVRRLAGARTGERAVLDQTQADWLEMRKLLDTLGEKDTKVSIGPKWAQVTRGPLPGAGAWTHEYGDPGNTACSGDQRVRGPIGVLWFGDPGPERMPSRHASAASPLAIGGRLFVQGENVVMAYDAYNGLLLWEREIPGAMRLGLKTTCSNLVADAGSLFVAAGETCHRLDAATGKTLQTYRAPPPQEGKPGDWMYLARAGDLVYGMNSGSRLFALEAAGGKTRWTYEGTKIRQQTIAIGSGRVFFVDQAATPEQTAAALQDVPAEARRDSRGRAIPPDVRLVVALDAETGRKAWERPQYVSDCVAVGPTGGELTTMVAHDVLLVSAQPWNGHFWKEFLAGDFSRRSLIALSAADGKPLWSGRKGYRSRPLIVGDRIIAEPWSYDLYTGAEQKRENPITGAADARWQMARPGHHCGNIVASMGALFFRSGTTAYYDMDGDSGTAHFGAQRPGCWINCLPANGVITMPEASSGCQCPFALQCTVVFHPRPTNRMWNMFSAPGSPLPVKHLAVNFGAPGDRRGADGVLWLSYPRPAITERLVLDLKVNAKFDAGGAFLAGNPDVVKVAGTADPWLYVSGARGLERCEIPLAEAGAAPARYTVRLFFAETDDAAPGRRVFNVKLQDRTVLADFDIARTAGGKARAVVKEFKGIGAGETLVLEMQPKSSATTAAAMPLLNAIEIVRE